MELSINNIVKLIIGIFVVAVVVTGLYLFFKNQVISFFKGVSTNSAETIFLVLK